MAEIRIEERRTGLRWLWLLVLLVIVAGAIVWYVLAQRNGAAAPAASPAPVGVHGGTTPTRLAFAYLTESRTQT